MQGKLIVIYGINNLGKSTQAKRLVSTLKEKGYDAEYLKYPLYDLEPSGAMINDYLRNNNPQHFSPREFQLIHLLNKLEFQEEIQKKLAQGTIIIAEDYKGTSIAWGIGAGVDEEFLKKINAALLDEDLVFLFDGERFLNSVEKNHTHEENKQLMEAVRNAHLQLGKENNWIIVPANRSKEEIHKEITKKVEEFLKI